MHELSLVQGIIDAVNDTAEKNGGRVKSFKVGVGELAQFDIRLVRQLLADITKGTPLEGARVVVSLERSSVRCLGCGKDWDFQEVVAPISEDEREMVHFLPELLSSYTRCPSCSKSYFEIEKGRSVRIVEVVLDD